MGPGPACYSPSPDCFSAASSFSISCTRASARSLPPARARLPARLLGLSRTIMSTFLLGSHHCCAINGHRATDADACEVPRRRFISPSRRLVTPCCELPRRTVHFYSTHISTCNFSSSFSHLSTRSFSQRHFSLDRWTPRWLPLRLTPRLPAS